MKNYFFLLLTAVSCKAYDIAYRDYSVQCRQSDAVAVVAYNRPQYLEQLIESIETNPEAQSLPFFFFLDGGDPKATEQNIELIKRANIAHKEIVTREYNYGCPKNHIDAKRFLFDWCSFERIVVMEEDLIVSKNYFRTLFRFHDWATQNYSNIGTVQLWSLCKLNKKKKQERLTQVKEVFPRWCLVTYCMGRSVWKDIAPFLFEYEQFIDPMLQDKRYDRGRSKLQEGLTAEACGNWARTLNIRLKRSDALKTFPQNLPLYHSKFTFFSPREELCLNQDVINTRILWLLGYTRLQTVVNHAAHIGENGISGSHEINVFLDEFDEEIKTFQSIDKRKGKR